MNRHTRLVAIQLVTGAVVMCAPISAIARTVRVDSCVWSIDSLGGFCPLETIGWALAIAFAFAVIGGIFNMITGAGSKPTVSRPPPDKSCPICQTKNRYDARECHGCGRTLDVTLETRSGQPNSPQISPSVTSNVPAESRGRADNARLQMISNFTCSMINAQLGMANSYIDYLNKQTDSSVPHINILHYDEDIYAIGYIMGVMDGVSQVLIPSQELEVDVMAQMTITFIKLFPGSSDPVNTSEKFNRGARIFGVALELEEQQPSSYIAGKNAGGKDGYAAIKNILSKSAEPFLPNGLSSYCLSRMGIN